MEDLIGRTLGPYRIEGEIGHGGMANVYRAIQPSIGRVVAIKVLPAVFLQDRVFLERFSREVQVIARLQHPRILQVIDSGEQDGLPYIVMAYIPGGTLADLIQRSGAGLSFDQTARLVSQMAEGLDYAHRQGVIHRDFKPSNVLLDQEGNVHLADFGIAKVTQDTAHLTGSGVIGTPQYMAPEMSDPTGLSPLVDVYALGVTVYQMLTGHHPYEAPTPMGVMLAHANRPIPDVRALRPDAPVAVQGVLLRGMAKDPARRCQSAGELAAGLNAAISGELPEAATLSVEERSGTIPVEQPHLPPPPFIAAPVPAVRRRDNRTALGIGVMAVVGCLTTLVMASAAAYFLWPRSEPAATREPITALTEQSTALTGITQPAAPPATEALVTLPPATAIFVASSTPVPALPTAFPTGPGGHIVFTCYVDGIDQICVMNADGSDQRQLTLQPGQTYYGAFSPDGGTISFASRSGGIADIYLMDVSGSNMRRLTQNHGDHAASDISPDGSRLVFVSTAGSDPLQSIWVMNRDGSEQTLIAAAGSDCVDPVWSPDGTQILFAIGEPDFKDLFIMDADGSNLRQVTFRGDLGGRSDWSPDGRLIAFYAGPRNNRAIYVIHADGTNETALTSPGSNSAPAFSPDSQWIVFTGSDGDLEIFIMRMDGSQLTQLTFNTRPDWQPRWGR